MPLTWTHDPQTRETIMTIGVFFGFVGRKIDGDSWFTWWLFLIYQGNPSISPLKLDTYDYDW